MIGDSSIETGYPRADRVGRLSTGLACAGLVAAAVWTLLDDLGNPRAIVVLVVLGGPVGFMAWSLLRGGMGRRPQLRLDESGLSRVVDGEPARAIPWSEVREIQQVAALPDPHLRVRAGTRNATVRIYYQIAKVGAVLERIARETSGCANAYPVPFTARRPSLARGMLPWSVISLPFFLVAVGSLRGGAVAPAAIFCFFGALALLVGYRLHVQQPTEVSVTHEDLVLTEAEGGVRQLRLHELTELRLGLSKGQPPRAALHVRSREGQSIAIDVAWADPIRLFALVSRLREGAR